MNTHGSDNESTKSLSSKAVLSSKCQFIEACFNPYKDSFIFSKYFELFFHDPQDPYLQATPYKQIPPTRPEGMLIRN